MTRGLVVPLTPAQVVKRALYLAGEVPIEDLDDHVRKDGAPRFSPTIYYLLTEHNGGKDPTAPDPADRWSKDGSTFVNVTCDCSGGNSWMHGFDRYQPKRMRASVGYDGWFNTDSKIFDITLPLKEGESRCFVDVGRPEPGTILTCKSGSPGHHIGHEGCVVGYNGVEWDPQRIECWDQVVIVDVSARGAQRANTKHSARGWYNTGAMFLRSVMQP